MTRDERQDLFIEKFIAANGKGTLEAATAFGKTRVALKIIQRLRRDKPERSVIIVVPHEYLKGQWEALLKDWKLSENTIVHIINGFVKKQHACSLLILDEIHRYAAETFSKVFGCVQYKFILGLTAMVKRLDKRQGIIIAHCPVIDTVSLEEARLGGYIAPYQEFNLGLTMNPEVEEKYKKLQETYESAMGTFQWDFGMMKHCLSSYKPHLDSAGIAVGSECERIAKKYGWKGNSPLEAYKLLLAKEKNIWGNAGHKFSPHFLYIAAINGVKAMKGMKDLICKDESKLSAAAALILLLPEKRCITFAELTETADEMVKRVAGSTAYHSSMTVTDPVTQEVLSKKKSRQWITDRIVSGEIKRIHTAKALDEGADFPEISLGIRISGTSSPVQQMQRRGRIIRKHENKEAVMINLYLKGTKEAQWLSKSQGYSEDIVWVDTIEEIIENVKPDA